MTKLKVIPSSDQKAMSTELMDEIVALIQNDKYDHMTVATVIGVLEMVKMAYWEKCE